MCIQQKLSLGDDGQLMSVTSHALIRRRRRLMLSALIAATALGGASIQAANWDHGAGDSLWGSATNWNPDGVPTNADSAIFAETTARTVLLTGGPYEVDFLSFTGDTASATTINNGVLKLNRINRTSPDNNKFVRTTADPATALNLEALGTTIEINNTNTGSFLGIEGKITATNVDLISTNTGRTVLGQPSVFVAADNNVVSNWNIAGGTLEARSVAGANNYNSLGSGVVNLSNSGVLDIRNDTNYTFGNAINIAGTNTIHVNRSGGTATGRNLTVGQITFDGANRSLTVTNGNSYNLVSNATMKLGDNVTLTTTPTTTVPSLTSTGAANTFNKAGAGNFIVSGAGIDFAGTTTVNSSNGTLTANNSSAFGTDATIAVTGTRSAYSQNGAALGGYTYNVAATGIIAGNNAFLGSLDLAGGNLTLGANGTIAQNEVGGNISVIDLPATPTYYFGISAALNESVAVGTGTPWLGISSDRASRTYTGTITANSDFSLQGGGTLVLGNTTITPATPTVATITGNLVQINGTQTRNANLTYEIASGATLQPVSDNSFGTDVDPALNAKVVVLSGGQLNPNGGNKVNANVTIQAGGILQLDDANNLTGAGIITQTAGSITRINNNGTTVLGGSQSPGTVPGSIIRLEAGDVRDMATKIDNAAIFQVFGGDRTLADNTIDGGVLTNDGSSRRSTNVGTTTANTITVGTNGATIAATTGTNFTMNLINSNTTGSFAITGGKLTIGSTTPIAGNNKAGTVVWGAASGFSVDVAEVEIVAGTLQGLGSGMTFDIGGGTGLLTVNNGATLDSRAGQLTNGLVNVLTGATARFRSDNGTDGSIANANIAGLQGAGNVFVGRNDTGTNRDVNLQIGSNNQNTVFSGVIADADATRNGRVTKVGTGTLELSGANTYTLGTIVNAGTLLVSNTSGSATGTGAVTVNASTLGGNGIISGDVTFNGNSFLVPGTSPGTLTTGALTLASTTTSVFEFTAGNTTVGGGINDLVIATDLTLDGTLSPTFLGSGNWTGDYVLFDYSGALTDSVLDIDPLFLANPNVLSASIVIDPVNTQVLLSVTATVIPEPSTWVLGSLTLLGLAGIRLRRRRA